MCAKHFHILKGLSLVLIKLLVSNILAKDMLSFSETLLFYCLGFADESEMARFSEWHGWQRSYGGFSSHVT